MTATENQTQTPEPQHFDHPMRRGMEDSRCTGYIAVTDSQCRNIGTKRCDICRREPRCDDHRRNGICPMRHS